MQDAFRNQVVQLRDDLFISLDALGYSAVLSRPLPGLFKAALSPSLVVQVNALFALPFLVAEYDLLRSTEAARLFCISPGLHIFF